MAEIEEALSRGTVDLITTSKSFGAERRLFPMSKYISVWPITPIFPQVIAINAKTWDRLDQKQKDGLMRASAQLTREVAVALEQMTYTYDLWIRSTKTELILPDEAEVRKAVALLQPVVKEWLDTAGPQGKEVLSIAAGYAKGPSAAFIKDMVK